MPEPSVGLALIARDEAQTLPRLLASIEGAFDQVVLVDTGSEDDTTTIFRDWCAAESERNHRFRFTIADFAWRDDFAAARNFADSLLTTDWCVWADCDDEVRGASNIRTLAENAPAEVTALIAGYDYAHDPHGNTVCYLRRERIVRRGSSEWAGRVHEAQVLQGAVQHVPADELEWVHHKPPALGSSERNVRILTAWLEDEPENARVLAYLGTESLAAGDLDNAEALFRRYIALKTGWDEERAQVYRKLAQALIAREQTNDTHQYEQALGLAFESLRLLPGWPDAHLTLAECLYHQGEWGKAAHWASEVLRIGRPDSMLILDPTSYTLAPRVILAGSLGQMGQIDEALEVADQAFQIAPHEGLAHGYRHWSALRKREQTAHTVVALAQVLTASDEQENALAVLQAAPHFCRDHPLVVAHRSQLRERIDPLYDPSSYAEHYETGGSKPEDAVTDERLMATGDTLPRCGFLLRSVQELAA